jgi:ATPase subunit of ABC transporter with duplicated ATPase domains
VSVSAHDYGTNCKDCERYQKLGDVCVVEHGKKFLWEYCRDFTPLVRLPDYKDLMRTVKQEQAQERQKVREKKERERKKKLKERMVKKEQRKKERRARLRRVRERKKKLEEKKAKRLAGKEQKAPAKPEQAPDSTRSAQKES